ncbi:hypothetical protein [Acidianus manzaensis]|uniref:Uncharacterized protein n=1 Tax=Acidianus manzaensis TaxID=282676 RepID=A0A1W6K1M3_9CREN|nr:hypothetical protein [Acidianus manzaensis]ARM76372.1 hypothetical protein B6F84_10305 [Acidianus manzaensis]
MSSCKEFDGLAATEYNIKRAEQCLKLTFLYIDRTTDPPLLRYIPFHDDYEIIGWIRKTGDDIQGSIDVEKDVADNLDDGTYFVIRFKNGKEILLDEDQLRHIDTLLKLKFALKK